MSLTLVNRKWLRQRLKKDSSWVQKGPTTDTEEASQIPHCMPWSFGTLKLVAYPRGFASHSHSVWLCVTLSSCLLLPLFSNQKNKWAVAQSSIQLAPVKEKSNLSSAHLFPGGVVDAGYSGFLVWLALEVIAVTSSYHHNNFWVRQGLHLEAQHRRGRRVRYATA